MVLFSCATMLCLGVEESRKEENTTPSLWFILTVVQPQKGHFKAHQEPLELLIFCPWTSFLMKTQK